MNAIYNEIDPFAADWLDSLIAAGHIGPGTVERRSIAELTAADVAGPGQRHFFAGIGGWSHALRLAGVPDDADVWTGSCPCQPFSSAGTRTGFDDPRHLWPAWFRLIRECRPPVVFGEQVAGPDGLKWLDVVLADLEGCGYTVGAAVLSAASVGAPHARHRIYFVAYADEARRSELRRTRLRDDVDASRGDDANRCSANGFALANAEEERRGPRRIVESHGRSPIEPGRQRAPRGVADVPRTRLARTAARNERAGLAGPGPGGCVGDSGRERCEAGRGLDADGASGARSGRIGPRVDVSARGLAHADVANAEHGDEPRSGRLVQPESDALTGFWSDAEWVECTDGVSRPVEPGTFPLAHGVSGRVGRLRGYGNAIVPQVAAAFIQAALEARGALR